jgi:hypothetical protein
MTGNIVMADDTSIGISDSDERIEFDGAGDISLLGCNVGIGTTSPQELLEVSSPTTGAWLRVDSGGNSGADNDEGIKFYSQGNLMGSIYFDGTSLNIKDDSDVNMWIGNNGHVGIGTTSPDTKLTIYETGVGEKALNVRDASNDAHRWYIEAGSEGLYRILNGGSTKIQLRADGDSYFNGGKVGIGTTPLGGPPSYHLDVQNQSGSDYIAMFRT